MTKEKYDKIKDLVYRHDRIEEACDVVSQMIERSQHQEWHIHHISIEGHKINGVGIPDTLELPILYMLEGEYKRIKDALEEDIKNI